MDTPLLTTLADIDHKYRMLEHFQSFLQRDDVARVPREMTIAQCGRVMVDLKALEEIVLKAGEAEQLNEIVKKYDLSYLKEAGHVA